jgi:hypothetical protein
MACRSSALLRDRQPMRAPMAAASLHRREQKARTSGSASTRSAVAPVIALTGFMRQVAPQLVPDVVAHVVGVRGVEAGVREQVDHGLGAARCGRRAARRRSGPGPSCAAPGQARAWTCWHAPRSPAPGRTGWRPRSSPPGSTLCRGAAGKGRQALAEPPGHAVHRRQHQGVRADQRAMRSGHGRERRALDGDDHQVLRAQLGRVARAPCRVPARGRRPCRSRQPCCCSAASVAPRASALTCAAAGSAASWVPMKPPMAPAPTMQTAAGLEKAARSAASGRTGARCCRTPDRTAHRPRGRQCCRSRCCRGSRAHEPMLRQQREVARDVGRAVAAQLRQLADAALSLAQQVEDLQPRRLGQRLEIRRHLGERFVG